MTDAQCLAKEALLGVELAFKALADAEGWSTCMYRGVAGHAEVTCKVGHAFERRAIDLLEEAVNPHRLPVPICRECARPEYAEASARSLRSRAEEQGITLVGPVEHGSAQALCGCGGTYTVYAHIYPGHPQLEDRCHTCEARARSEELDWFYRQAEAEGVTMDRRPTGPHQRTGITCPLGHEDRVNAMQAFKRGLVCRRCSGSVHNTPFTVFYVVQHPETSVVKFGVSRGSGESRLRQHAEMGYTTRHRKLVDLPGSLAKEVEDHCKAALAAAGWCPVEGSEWFEGAALGLVIDTADRMFVSAGISAHAVEAMGSDVEPIESAAA